MDPEEQEAAEEERIRALAESAAEQDASPDHEEQPADGEAAAEEASETPPARVPGRGLERRISALATDKRTLQAQLAAAQEENERLRAARSAAPEAEEDPPAAAPGAFRGTQEEFDRAVAAEAARQAAARVFNDRCNQVDDEGRKLDPNRWAEAKRNLGLLDDGGVIPMALLEPALETDAPHEVILALGEDPDRAADLLAMSPTKRAMEIARMSARKTAPKAPPRSTAPPPVQPIGRRGPSPGGAAPSDRDSDEEWAAKRKAEVLARQKAG